MRLDVIEIGAWLLICSCILAIPILFIGLIFVFAGYIDLTIVCLKLFLALMLLAAFGTLMTLIGDIKSKVER